MPPEQQTLAQRDYQRALSSVPPTFFSHATDVGKRIDKHHLKVLKTSMDIKSDIEEQQRERSELLSQNDPSMKVEIKEIGVYIDKLKQRLKRNDQIISQLDVDSKKCSDSVDQMQTRILQADVTTIPAGP